MAPRLGSTGLGHLGALGSSFWDMVAEWVERLVGNMGSMGSNLCSDDPCVGHSASPPLTIAQYRILEGGQYEPISVLYWELNQSIYGKGQQ